MSVDKFEILNRSKAAYLCHADFKDQLLAEIADHCIAEYDQLLLTDELITSVWAQNIWLDPVVVKIESINDAKNKLKQIKKNWTCNSHSLHRRSSLIAEGLSKPKNEGFDFNKNQNFLPIDTGYFSLLAQDIMLYSAKTTSPFVNGLPNIVEDRVGPPARAYLKLLECFMRIGQYPKPKELCLELGASPGSWTWVLLKLGAKVIAYDRADLDHKIKKLGDLQIVLKDAFTAKPNDFDKLDWLFSDLICYPDKLYDYVCLWLESEKCKNFVCTLKFQGAEHYYMIDKFLEIPNSMIFHSYYNKHELTWVRLGEG